MGTSNEEDYSFIIEFNQGEILASFSENRYNNIKNRGGGMPLKKRLNNKGFAVSGILYPILILTIFLIVEILTLMSTRKTVLDKSKQELLNKIDESGRVYTNEELSAILDDLTSKRDSVLGKTYPVGSVYISISDTDPKTVFGGTWEAYGKGRVLVGVSSSESEFNSVNKTGGIKEASHAHGSGASQNGTLSAAIGSTDSKTVNMGFKAANFFGGFGTSTYTVHGSNFYSGGSFNHFTQVWGDTNQTKLSLLQPYITVYMWRRTA